ncbi:hypothetical protein ACJ5LQ_001696 [Campylobacter jejuni]
MSKTNTRPSEKQNAQSHRNLVYQNIPKQNNPQKEKRQIICQYN